MKKNIKNGKFVTDGGKSKTVKQVEVEKLSYQPQFLRNPEMNSRGEKSIYVRLEYHERLSRIVQVIGMGKIPLYAYLDNILKHHFELFEQEIIKDYNSSNKPIF